MKKVILMSIKPKWLEKILSGEKTIEIRKTMPKCELPIEVWLYCTKKYTRSILIDRELDRIFYENRPTFFELDNCGKVVVKFTLNKVEHIKQNQIYNATVIKEKACLSVTELNAYVKGKDFYAWHIDNLVIFDKLMVLGEFHKIQSKADHIKIAPMSWYYAWVD